MQSAILKSFEPSANTSEAIEAALNKIIAETKTTTARAKKLSAELEAGALVLNSKERRALRDDLEDAELDLAQLAALKTSTKAALVTALHNGAREAIANGRAALVARLGEHEAVFLERYRIHETAILELLAERNAIGAAIEAHNHDASAFLELRIGGGDELKKAVTMTRFFKTDAEIAAIQAAEQSRRNREHYERQAMLQERHRVQCEYAASRPEQLPPVVVVHSPGGDMVKRI